MDIPYYNRPWTKLKENGVNSLDNAELLSVIISRGNKKLNAIELSNKLLKNYSLSKLYSLSFGEINAILEDDVKTCQVMSVLELSNRISKLQKNGYRKSITKAYDVYTMLYDELKFVKKEYLYVLLLDTKNCVIAKQVVSVGTLSASLIHPREVFNLAIKENANSIILVHNHPSGDPSPSDADISICKRLIETGNLVGIKMLDFIIIGDKKFWSYVQHSL